MFGAIPAKVWEKMLEPNGGDDMREDAFSKHHPAVNFLFFVGAVCFGVLMQHPIYLSMSVLASGTYYILLHGKKGWRMIAGTIPLFVFIAIFNPIVNTRGGTILFHIFERPYTLEALLYGCVVAAIFVAMMLWMGCYGKVLTGDKFTSLFGNLIPSVSLLLVMIFRMIPSLYRKARQIIHVRGSIGKGTEETASVKDKVAGGMTVLGVLTSWALEGSVVTSDSMRARGYGTTKRTSFRIYKMKEADWSLVGILLLLIGIIVCFVTKGCMHAEYFPRLQIVPIKSDNVLGFIAYLGYLFVPIILHIKEEMQWNNSK